MRWVRAVLVAVLLGLVACGPALAAWPFSSSNSNSRSRPVKKTKAQPTAIDKIGSATTGLLQGVKDTLTFKRQPQKKPLIKSSPLRSEQTKTATSGSWFANGSSK